MKNMIFLLLIISLISSCSYGDSAKYKEKLKEIEESYQNGEITSEEYTKKTAKIYRTLTRMARRRLSPTSLSKEDMRELEKFSLTDTSLKKPQ